MYAQCKWWICYKVGLGLWLRILNAAGLGCSIDLICFQSYIVSVNDQVGLGCTMHFWKNWQFDKVGLDWPVL